MRIAIPMQIFFGKKTGIGYYAENLIKHISKIDSKNSYFLYAFTFQNYNKKINKVFIPKQKNFIPKFKRIPGKIVIYLNEKFNLPIEYFIGPFDILHSLDSRFPIIKKAKLIVTIHDLAFLLFPEYTANDNFIRTKMKRYIKNATTKADKIITVSNSSKDDIMHIFGIPEKKIRVTYEAAGTIFRQLNISKSSKKIKCQYGLPNDFILCVSTLEPRKNISGLIKAYAISKSYSKFSYKLVIVGNKSVHYTKLAKLVDSLNLNNDVLFIGYIGEDELPLIYNLAKLFVYPTNYEGFGLPVIEAMACGLPVIASNNSSLPEVVGNAGVLVDSQNIEELGKKIYKVSTDESYLRNLKNSGLERAKFFSWEKCAQNTLKVYEEVYSLEK